LYCIVLYCIALRCVVVNMHGEECKNKTRELYFS
jgi:hypothetical protein